MVSLGALSIGFASCASVYVRYQLGMLALLDLTLKLTDSSMSGMASISGILSSSSVMPISRSISISISAAIVDGQATDFGETLQVVHEAAIGNGMCAGEGGERCGRAGEG